MLSTASRTRVSLALFVLTVTSGLLVGCSSGEEKTPEESPTVESTEPTAVVPSPKLNTGGMTTVSPQEDVLDSFNNSSQDVRDQWFIDQMEEAGVVMNQESMMTMRRDVCSMLDNGVTAENLSRRLSQTNESLTDKQKGVVVASSMVSWCPDTSLSVNEKSMPTP